MAKVEQEVVVKIKTLIEGLNEVKAYSDAVKGIGKGGGASLTSNFLKAGAAAGGVNAVVTKMLDLLATAVELGARAFAGFVSEGIKFNATIESAKIGIATIVANTYDIKDAKGNLLDPVQSFNAALEKSDDLERALQKSAIQTKFEFQDILSFFNSSVIASAGLKTNLDQILRLTQDFALAAGAANIDVEKVNTGIQQILTGNTTVRNQLARVVFPGLGTKEINEQLKKYKEAGTLVDFLEEKLKVFRLSADQVGQSFEAVASNATDALKVFEAASTKPLFDKIKQTLGFIINQIVDLSGETVKLTPTFQKIADLLGGIGGFLGERLLEITIAIFGYLDKFADYLDNNYDTISQVLVAVYTIAEQVALILFDLGYIVGDVAQANTNAQGWLTVTQAIALFLGFIRDVLNIIIGTAEGITGWFLQIASIILNGISIGLQDLINRTRAWLGWLTPVALTLGRIANTIADAGESITNSGTDRLISGLNSDGLANAANGINRQLPTLTLPKRTSGLNFSPRTVLNKNDKGGRDAAKREADERIKEAQRLFNEIEKYQIANANRALEIATQGNKLLLDEEQRRYDKGLTSAEAFYKRKAEIENTDLDNQADNLKKQKEYADLALKRDLGALAGKFEVSDSEVDAIIAKIKDLADTPGGLAGADKNTIKQAIEYTKYLEQTAEITQKLNLIEVKRKDIKVDTTEATEKQARANKLLLDSLAGELATSQGNGGLTELFNLQKRVSDELPKILSETSKGVPGVEKFAEAIRDAGEVDISRLPAILEETGVDFDSLSDEARLFIRLLERLQALANIKTTQAAVEQAQNAFKFAGEGIKDDFANGRTNLSGALAATQNAKAEAVKTLTTAYEAQKKVLADLQAKNLATPQDVQNVETLRRAIQALNGDLDEFALIQEQIDRDQNLFGAKADAIEARRNSGAISAKTAKQENLILQQQQIAALEDELVKLQALDQSNIEVQQRVAETKNRIAELRNQTNADFINFAQGVNGQIGSAFSNFLDTIIEGTQSIGDAFRQLLASLLLGIAKAIAQALLLKFILEPLGLTGGDSGGAGGFLGGLIFGKPKGKATGGIISGSGTGVSDTAGIYALSHGEGVIPAARVRQYGASMINSIINGSFLPRFSIPGLAGGMAPSVEGGGRGTRIINTVDPNLVRDFLHSAEGEEIIVNVIGKNPNLVQRVVN